MVRDITIPAKECECDICHYRWISIATTLPESCRNIRCRSREWNGRKGHGGVATSIRLPRPAHRPRTIHLIESDEI